MTWVEHYLDDYITMGPSGSGVCEQNLKVMLSYCQKLGVPVSAEKCASPSSKVTFLGFELDTISMVIRLPEEKLQRIKLLVQKWMVGGHAGRETLSPPARPPTYSMLLQSFVQVVPSCAD